LALPLAASKGEMPLAQEVQKRMAEIITIKNITFLLMVKSFTCLKKLVSVNKAETLQRYCNVSPKIGKTITNANLWT
jgi:hypothetical protein